MPFLSEYNDYGGGENSSGVAFEPTLKALSEHLIEMEVGENEYHDIAVKREGFGEEQFFRSVHESRLKVPDWRGDGALVDFVMMRKDVVDQVLATHFVENYVGDGKGTCGYNNNYIRYGFADIVAGLPEFFAKVREQAFFDEDKEVMIELESMDPNDPQYIKTKSMLASMRRIRYGMNGLSNVYNWKEHTITARYFGGDSHRHFRLVPYSDMILNALEAGDDALATEIATTYLTGKFIDCFMSECRKVWIPAGHEGSQATELQGYKTLVSVLSNVIAAEEKRWGDDEE